MFITIAGAGIGGLTAAPSLHAAGFGCQVLEAARRPRPLGAGNDQLPHAVRELTVLGLGEAPARAAIPTEQMVHLDRFGNRFGGAARGLAACYHWPQVRDPPRRAANHRVERGWPGQLVLQPGAATRGRRGRPIGSARTGRSTGP
jgi:2-polyprenyl-6-methoxyphenol hydroxylase-like FAD-dependent oxidoreductase